MYRQCALPLRQSELIPGLLADGLLAMPANLMDLGSDLVETYNSIKCLGMVQASAKTDPWSIHKLARDETCRMDQGSVVIRLSGPDVNSHKPQASSLTAGPGYDRMDLERNNYGQ